MTESSFPWPRKGTENRRLSAVVGAFLLAIDVLPTARKSVLGPEAALLLDAALFPNGHCVS